MHYINRQGQEQYMTMREYPQDLDKKMKLLTYFRRYMTEHLMKAGKVPPYLYCIDFYTFFERKKRKNKEHGNSIVWILQIYDEFILRQGLVHTATS